MIVYLMLAITLVVALISLLMPWRWRKAPVNRYWPLLLLAGALAGFIYLYGTWVFISVYGKYVFGACFVVMFMISLGTKKEGSKTSISGPRAVGYSFLAAICIALIILYFTGTSGKPYGIANLSLPFKTGTYFVFQGGKGLPTNIFHYTGRHTVYAMDIIKLNKFGNRANHIFSNTLTDYETFGDTIYSPCSGVIQKTESTNPDNIPPSRKRGPANLNCVLIATESMYVFLGHLKQGCVFVHEGDTVTTGQPLGLAGNSGNSLEPHVHIQVHARTNTTIPWYKEPQLLINFNGKSYLLFQEIKAGQDN